MATTHHLEVTKTARYFQLGDSSSAEQIWFVLHGYGQSAERFIAKFDFLAKRGHAVIAPEGLHRFYTKGFSGEVGASWMTKEERETDIKDYIAYLNLLAQHCVQPRQKLYVLGFSQGAATACRWIGNGAVRPEALLLWAGLVPPDIDLGQNLKHLKETRVILAQSDTDEFRNEAMWDEQFQLLNRCQIPFTGFNYTGGHRIVAEELERLISNHLNQPPSG